MIGHQVHRLIMGQTAAEAPAPGLLEMLPMFAMMFAVMYFLVLRPSQRQRQRHTEMLNALKKGDEVATDGGVLGRIYALEDKVVTLEVAAGVRLRVQRAHIAGVVTKEGVVAETASSRAKKSQDDASSSDATRTADSSPSNSKEKTNSTAASA